MGFPNRQSSSVCIHKGTARRGSALWRSVGPLCRLVNCILLRGLSLAGISNQHLSSFELHRYCTPVSPMDFMYGTRPSCFSTPSMFLRLLLGFLTARLASPPTPENFPLTELNLRSSLHAELLSLSTWKVLAVDLEKFSGPWSMAGQCGTSYHAPSIALLLRDYDYA